MTGLLGFAGKAIACAGIAAGGAFAAQSHYDGELDAVSQAAISSDANSEVGVKAGAEIGSGSNLDADASVSGEATGEFALADCSDDCLEVEGLTSLEASAISSNEISAAAESGLNCECAAAASSADAEAHSTVEAQGGAESDAMAAEAGASSGAEAETGGTSSGSLAGEVSIDAGVTVEAD